MQLPNFDDSSYNVAEAEFGPMPKGAFWVPARMGGGAPTLEEAEREDKPAGSLLEVLSSIHLAGTDKILLAKNRMRNSFYSLIAGYVDAYEY